MEQQLQLVVRKLYEHILIKKKSSLGFNSQIHFIRSEMPEGLQSQTARGHEPTHCHGKQHHKSKEMEIDKSGTGEKMA